MLGQLKKQSYNWSVSSTNYATLTVAGFGTAITAGASNTMSGWTSMLSNTEYESCGIEILVGAAGTAGAARGFLLDVGVDPIGEASAS